MTEFVKYLTSDAAAFTATILLLWMFKPITIKFPSNITLTLKNQDKEGE
jgi:hypothetical protein